jgi:signal transduction histidine kinase
MAEIATGVLHNVGNVLTSLSVTVSVVGDKLRDSKISALSRGIKLFAGEPGGLPAFLATEKGKLFPPYLVSVTEHLAEENGQLIEELESVASNVEHIKSIVAMQQTYARVTAHNERLDMGLVIDDALTMGEVSFARHGIEIVKEYGEVPPVFTDRHKILQILLNLISNARHALKDGAGGAGQLTVRLRSAGERIAIDVGDTGVGIPTENLCRIFQHGFTTKKEGHGFGLHAAANSARELGGTLIAASGGPGQGATFTLELPAEAPVPTGAECDGDAFEAGARSGARL